MGLDKWCSLKGLIRSRCWYQLSFSLVIDTDSEIYRILNTIFQSLVLSTRSIFSRSISENKAQCFVNVIVDDFDISGILKII